MTKKYKAIILSTIICVACVISITVIGIVGWYGYMKVTTLRSPFYSLTEAQYVAHGLFYSDSLENNSLSLYKYLIDERGYKIVECDVLFTQDNIPVLSHEANTKSIAVTEDGKDTNYEIANTSFDILSKLNFSVKRDGKIERITKAEDLLRFLKKRNVCVQFDMQKYIFSKEQYAILYDIVAKCGMLDKVIWEVNDANFKTLALMDPNLIYQLDYSWNKQSIDWHKKKRFFSSMIFVSLLLKDGDYKRLSDFADIIDYAHKNGFMVKCAAVNDAMSAKILYDMGVDLIVTDSLK